MSTADFFDILRTRIPIADVISKSVVLKKQNRELVGLCPFHSEKTPSFKVNTSKNFYYCFGCGANGNVINFISQIQHLSYKEAGYVLAQDFNIEIPQLSHENAQQHDEIERIHQTLELANKNFIQCVNFNVAEYLKTRNIHADDIAKFEIGYARAGCIIQSQTISILDAANAGIVGISDTKQIYEVFKNRITFPIRDRYGKLVGFGGRVMSDIQPKYLNSPETSVFKKNKILYAANIAIPNAYKLDALIVVEGYIDCIMLHQYGFNNAVATLGTAVSVSHLLEMWKSVSDIIICMDGDNAGLHAAQKVISLALEHITVNNQISFVLIPDNMDPDQFLNLRGKESFTHLLNTRKTFSEMIWYINTYNIKHTTAEQGAKLEFELNATCAKIRDKTLFANYSRFFKSQCWAFFTQNTNQYQNVISRTKSKLINASSGNNAKQYSYNQFQYLDIHDRKALDFTESDTVEYSIIALILQDILILKDECVRKDFLELEIIDQDLRGFWEYIVNCIKGECDIDKLNATLVGDIQDSEYMEIYSLLMKFNVSRNLKSLSSKLTQKHLWQLLIKKQVILRLQHQYKIVLQRHDNADSIAQFYITKIQQEQRELNILINN